MVEPYADQRTNFAASLLAAVSTVTLTLTVWWFVESNLEGDVSAGWSTVLLGHSIILINVIAGPLSLFIDVGFEFNIISGLSACATGLFTLKYFRNQAYKDDQIYDNSKKSAMAKYAAVAPMIETDENDNRDKRPVCERSESLNESLDDTSRSPTNQVEVHPEAGDHDGASVPTRS